MNQEAKITYDIAAALQKRQSIDMVERPAFRWTLLRLRGESLLPAERKLLQWCVSLGVLALAFLVLIITSFFQLEI